MLKTFKFFVIAMSAIIITSCGEQDAPVFSEKVDIKNIESLVDKVAKDEVIKAEDINHFMNGLTRMALDTSLGIDGKTVGDIIEAQKAFIKENTGIALVNTGLKLQLALAHKMKFVGYVPKDTLGQSYTTMVFEVTNTTDKTINGIKGALQFYTQTNQLVKNYPIVTEKIYKDIAIKPNETKQIRMPFIHDPANDRDQMIRTSLGTLKPVWVCTELVFSDGSKMVFKKDAKEEAK